MSRKGALDAPLSSFMSVARRPPLRVVTEPPVPDGLPASLHLDELFRRYSAYVAYIGVRILGQDDDVDDLVQDVFVEAARGVSRLADPGAVKGWLGTVTVRVASRRLKVRRLRRFLRLEDAPVTDVRWAGADPEQCATIGRLYRILDLVPARHRIAWLLRVVEGESLEETARLCGCSLATVKRWIAEVQRTIDREARDER